MRWMTWDQPNVPLSHNYFLNKHDNQSIVQWKVALLEPNSTAVYDAGFTMIAEMFKFKLTLWSIYLMFDDNYFRQMCVCLCHQF